jgi:hypothetical protein
VTSMSTVSVLPVDVENLAVLARGAELDPLAGWSAATQVLLTVAAADPITKPGFRTEYGLEVGDTPSIIVVGRTGDGSCCGAGGLRRGRVTGRPT